MLASSGLGGQALLYSVAIARFMLFTMAIWGHVDDLDAACDDGSVRILWGLDGRFAVRRIAGKAPAVLARE